jgi:hypothetical protein
MECFICLNEMDISQNSFYLKCCKCYVHEKCIKSWIFYSKNNNKCPRCKKKNNDLANLLEIEDNIDIIILDNNYSNINIQNNNYSYLCSFILITLGILIIILFFRV